MNAKMPALKKALEAGGFADVKTVLASGNVVFGARGGSIASIEKKVEAAIEKGLGRTFLTIVRPVDALHAILASDPFGSFRLAAGAKRVVTFLRRAPTKKLSLPIELDAAKILCMKGTEVFTAYVPGPRGPVFMNLLEKTLGTEITTRTWDTVKKVAR
jgi:uncharacterized protein (DUF1697 family)